jgi:hypothetical protein
MTSDRKISANRANAQASTGPKTSRGRDRSAKNAFRHGLSLPVQAIQALSEEAHALARQIAGPRSSTHVQMLAVRIAEAQIDLRRVRYVRHQLVTRALSDPHYDNRANAREKVSVIRNLLRRSAPEVSVTALAKFVISTPEGLQKFATIFSQEAEQLLSTDRYERRALSRRKFAIRAFDAARS